MRIAIVTMVHNEAVFLPLWIKHYSKVSGAQLIVVDNGSDDGSTDELPTNIEKITFPHREIIRDTARTEAMSNFQNSLIQYYDRVIYTDVDEFIVIDPDLNTDLVSFIAEDQRNNIAPVGLNVIHRDNIEGPIDFSEPILSQRQWVCFSSDYCKPLITRDKIKWMPGFHGSDKIPWITKNIYLFHLRLVDRDLLLLRTQERKRRTLEGQTWDIWGRSDEEVGQIFDIEKAKPTATETQNFNFSDDVNLALQNVRTSPDGSLRRLGHVDGAYLHKIPDRFLNEIEGIGA
jgi:glycosyltransferase involved in cell wall biosynthesis